MKTFVIIDSYVGNFVSSTSGRGQPYYRLLLKETDDRGNINFAMEKCTKAVYESVADGTIPTNQSVVVYYDKFGRIVAVDG